MLEETIKELCRLTKIPEEAMTLCGRADAQFKNKSFELYHYVTKELEGIAISYIKEEDIEIDIMADPTDSTYIMEVRIKTYCICEAKDLAKSVEGESSVFLKAKKRIEEKTVPCDNPYDSQAIILIEQNEQKEAAGFAYALLEKYISKKDSENKKAEAERKKQNRLHGKKGKKKNELLGL